MTRTSTALRAILAERPVVYAGYGQFPAFDPQTQPASVLDGMLADGLPYECAYAGTVHRRTLWLARELYPEMQLVPLVCGVPDAPGLPDTTALARHVFARFCD